MLPPSDAVLCLVCDSYEDAADRGTHPGST